MTSIRILDYSNRTSFETLWPKFKIFSIFYRLYKEFLTNNRLLRKCKFLSANLFHKQLFEFQERFFKLSGECSAIGLATAMEATDTEDDTEI